MMNLRVSFGLTMVAALLLSLGCGEESSQKADAVVAPADDGSRKIDAGTVIDNIYHNEFFGVSVTFPAQWHVQDQESHEQLVSAGLDVMGADDPQAKALLDSSVPRTTNLFAVFEHPLGAAVEFNPSVIGTAESLAHVPGVTSGADYFFHTRRFFESSQMDVTLQGETEAVVLGGRSFSTFRMDMRVMGMTVHQRYYALVADGQAFTIVLSFITSEQEAALDAIMETVRFD